MIRTIFLDRDGTINEEAEDEMVDSMDKVKILPNTIAALKLLKNTDFRLFIITNQIAIGLGRLSLNDFNKINNYILGKLRVSGIKIEQTYMCPHLPGDNCECRKPKPGMIKQAYKKYDINLKESYVIGDRETDILMGKKVGCKTILVKSGISKTNDAKADYFAEDLLDAVEFILTNEK